MSIKQRNITVDIAKYLGIVFTLTLSNFLSVLRIGKTLADLGKKTMSVLIWHFTAFRIVTAVQMTIFSLPFCTIFTHPCNMINGIWPLVYILAGLFVPFILSVLSERLSLK